MLSDKTPYMSTEQDFYPLRIVHTSELLQFFPNLVDELKRISAVY